MCRKKTFKYYAQGENIKMDSTINLDNPRDAVFRIYKFNVLDQEGAHVQDGSKFHFQGKEYIILEHNEQLKYMVENLDYTINKLLKFFPIHFIGRIAQLKDDFIAHNLDNIKAVLNNDVVYRICNEAISIKGFAPFISDFEPPKDRKHWISIGPKNYVVYRLK